MMKTVRAMGRELMNASPTELCIGNVIIRVLYFIREEYSQKLRMVEESGGGLPLPMGKRSHRSGSEGEHSRRDRSASMASSAGSERAEDGPDACDAVDIESDPPRINVMTKKLSEASLSGRLCVCWPSTRFLCVCLTLCCCQGHSREENRHPDGHVSGRLRRPLATALSRKRARCDLYMS